MTSPPPIGGDGSSTLDAPTPPVPPIAPKPALPPTAPLSHQLPEHSDFKDSAEGLLDQAQTWMEQNQTVAMIGAFALGTFLGLSLRR